jgi:hypothetical protein
MDTKNLSFNPGGTPDSINILAPDTFIISITGYNPGE